MAEGVRPNQHEAQILSATRELADDYGWLHYHAPQCHHAARQSEPGFPDLILVRADRLLAMEIKRDKPDEPSAAQMAWLRGLSEVRSATSYVVRPAANYDAIEALLR